MRTRRTTRIAVWGHYKGIKEVADNSCGEADTALFLLKRRYFEVIVEVVHVHCLDVVPLECPELIQTAI
jgi:hypothetical protein